MLYSKSLLFIYLDIWYCASVNTMLLLLSHFSHVQLLLPLNPSSPFPLKNLPAMQETLVLSLGGEDPLEKGMASHSSIVAWKIPWTGVWQSIVHMVAKNQTRLKQLSMHTRIYVYIIFFRYFPPHRLLQNVD